MTATAETATSPADTGAGTGSAALWACLAAGFATLFDAMVITYAAPAVSASLGGSTAGIQWLLASFSLTFGLGLIPSGRLGDVYGRRRLFTVGLLVFLAGGVLAVLSPTMVVLVAARFVQGLGAGIISAQVLGAIQDIFTGPARIRALGAYTASGALAALVGPVLAAVVLATTGPDAAWRIILLLPLPLVVAAIVLGLVGIPQRVAENPRSRVALDLPGILLLCAIVVAVTLPVVEPGLSGWSGIAIAAAAVIAVGVLVAWERRYAHRGRLPLFAPALVRSRGFVAGNLVALLWFGSGMGVGAAVTLYFLQAPHLTALAIAIVFAPGALARLVVSLFSQRIFAALGPVAVWIGLVLQIVLFLVLAIAAPVVDDASLLVLAAAVQVGLGVSGGLVEPPLRAMTLSFAPPELHGVAASFLQLTQRLAATFLVALATGILLTTTGVSTAVTLQAALFACAIAALLGLAAAADPTLRRAGAVPARAVRA